MARELTRAQLLAGMGTVSLGVLLGACGGARSSGAGTASTTGTTAAVQRGVGVDARLEALLDETGSCRLTTELAEGPYFFDVDSIRSDIREDRPGTPLQLALRLLEADGCTPIGNAVVDVWHCDAGGVYSGFEAASIAANGGDPDAAPAGGFGGGNGGRTDDETYLRGAQVTNNAGIVQFLTVYPGWYEGRAVHIHLKVHLDRTTLLVSQLFFDEDVTERVFRAAPYSERPADRRVRNDEEGIFNADTLLALQPADQGHLGLLNLVVERT